MQPAGCIRAAREDGTQQKLLYYPRMATWEAIADTRYLYVLLTFLYDVPSLAAFRSQAQDKCEILLESFCTCGK